MSGPAYSVRRRLTWVLAAGFAALILAAGVALDAALRRRVTAEFDAALVARARSFVALTEEEAGRIELDYRAEAMPEFERAERPDYFQFWLDDGAVLLRSPRLEGDLPRPAAAPSSPVVGDAVLPDGRAGRVATIAFVPAPAAEGPASDGTPASKARGLVLAVARGRESIDPLLAGFRVAVAAVGAVAALLAFGLVWRALASGFRPIDSLASQVGRLDAEGLVPVALARTPAEIAPVVEQLNALLARLRASFERERRFTGNVAHELRTPIAELRSLAAVGARWPDDAESVGRFFGDVGDVARRMEKTVADLLLLARCQAGVEPAVGVPTDLRGVVETAWSRLAPAASRSGLRLRLDVPADLVVESDPDKLSIVVGNVLGNAVSHSLPNGEIRCAATRDGEAFRLEVENPAEPLSAEDLRRLGEPFWRKDESRSSAEHAGLGLALVSALARLLRLDVQFRQHPDGTFQVRLEGKPPGRPALA